MSQVQVTSTALAYLIGQRFCAVTFIHDYFQFLIGEEILTVGVAPILWTPHGIKLTAGDQNYRNTLCERIGETVSDITESDTEVWIDFTSKFRIEISLQHPSGFETLVARNQDGTTVVF